MYIRITHKLTKTIATQQHWILIILCNAEEENALSLSRATSTNDLF